MKLRSSFVKVSQFTFRGQNLNVLKARQLKVHHIDQYSFTNIYKLYKNVGFKYPFSSCELFPVSSIIPWEFFFQSEIRSTSRLLLEISFKVGKLFPVSSLSSSELLFPFQFGIPREFCVKFMNIFLFHRRARKTRFVWKLERI